MPTAQIKTAESVSHEITTSKPKLFIHFEQWSLIAGNNIYMYIYIYVNIGGRARLQLYQLNPHMLETVK